jgi:hypothetical protein
MGALVDTRSSGIVHSLVVLQAAQAISNAYIFGHSFFQRISKSAQRCIEKIFTLAAPSIVGIFADRYCQATEFI